MFRSPLLRKKRKDRFQPDRDFLRKAIEEYFNLGGTVKVIQIEEGDYEKFRRLQSDSDIRDF